MDGPDDLVTALTPFLERWFVSAFCAASFTNFPSAYTELR